MLLNNSKLNSNFLIFFRFLTPNKPIIPFKLFNKKKSKNKLSFYITKQFLNDNDNHNIKINNNLSENRNKDDNCNTEDESAKHSYKTNEKYDFKDNCINNHKKLTILSMLYEN